MQITICGGGNAAHVLVGLLAARKGLRVYVYAPYGDEARSWREAIDTYGGISVATPTGTLKGRPQLVTDSPGAVVPSSQLVLLAVPAFAHETVLRAIGPFLADDAWLGSMPARGGFDWCVCDNLGSKSNSIVTFGLQTLPWACRIQKYGREAMILGTKVEVDLAARPAGHAHNVAALLSDLMDIHLRPVSNFLSLSLANTGQLIHSGVMYGLFQTWRGQLYSEAPLFYQGISREAADILSRLSHEVQQLRSALERKFPGLDLSAVRPLHEWLLRSYPDTIEDPSCLRTSFVTNRSYAGLRAPMRPAENGLVPDFQARYLSEDIPYGLVVTRGIAELAQVLTPTINQVINWAQVQLDREYLVAGKLQGRDVMHSRAPQRYGLTRIDEIIRFEGEYGGVGTVCPSPTAS